jgi:hypothetical protein
MAEELTPGKETSEAAAARSGSAWGIVATLLGMVVTLGASVAAGLGADTKIGIIVGGVVAIAGILQKTLTDLGYIGSRTQVKKTFYAQE